MSEDRRLWVACQQLLTVCADALTAAGAGYLPDVQLVQQGPRFAWDPCERLVVHPERLAAVQQVSPGGLAASGCAVVPVATLTATVLYCIPKAGDDGRAIPDVAAIGAASERLHVAGMTMWRAVARARKDGTWGDCDGVTVDEARPTGAQGGYAGWAVPVTVELSGLVTGS